MTARQTPRQKLVTHLVARHGFTGAIKGTHNQLALRHQTDHDDRHLAHKHRQGGIVLGGEIINFRIFLSPPKNPGASRNGDRNWTLQLTTDTGGFRQELAGTFDGDVKGAKEAATRILGWYPNWVPIGWGFQHQDQTTNNQKESTTLP